MGTHEELTAVQVAEEYGESVNTIRAAIKRGLLPSRFVGEGRHKVYLVTRVAVEQYLADRKPGMRERVANNRAKPKPVSNDV